MYPWLINLPISGVHGPKGRELSYAQNSQIPYTGWAKEVFTKSGQVGALWYYKDGKKESHNQWYENGQKRLESHYKDGKQDGPMIGWYDRWNSTTRPGRGMGFKLSGRSRVRSMAQSASKLGLTNGMELNKGLDLI